jgi:hypothetical protein
MPVLTVPIGAEWIGILNDLFSARSNIAGPREMSNFFCWMKNLLLLFFDAKITDTRGTGSNGIHPLTEDVHLRLEAFSLTVPAGSFTGRQPKFSEQ